MLFRSGATSDVLVGLVNAGGTSGVANVTAGRDILESGADGAADIVAATATLTAANDIGGGAAIETTLGTLNNAEEETQALLGRAVLRELQQSSTRGSRWIASERVRSQTWGSACSQFLPRVLQKHSLGLLRGHFLAFLS